jgi:hypothetical protein
MAQTSDEKGAALERAVAMIESTILERNPELRGHNFSIECRKTIVFRGVKHEIDIFVTIPRGDGYDSVFIFECKNTAENVGKNDIVLFTEKINATCAARGFVVAMGFGEYARAQAEQNPRIVLVEASENLASAEFLQGFQVDVSIDPNLVYAMRERGTALVVKPNDEDAVVYRGRQISFKSFIHRLVENLTDRRLEKADVKDLLPGIYTLTMGGNLHFPRGALVADGRDIEVMNCKLTVGFKRVRPKILCRFKVDGRGRYVEFEDIEISRGRSLTGIRAVALASDEKECG